MDIISKEKKEISWRGLPSNSPNDLNILQKELSQRLKKVEKKKECLQELLIQNVSFRNLVRENRERGDVLSDYSKNTELEADKIPLPFIVLNTSNEAVIQCEMCEKRTDAMFDFNMPFEINDDNEILKRLKMDKTTVGDLKGMLPPELMSYCIKHKLLDCMISTDDRDRIDYSATNYKPQNISENNNFFPAITAESLTHQHQSLESTPAPQNSDFQYNQDIIEQKQYDRYLPYSELQLQQQSVHSQHNSHDYMHFEPDPVVSNREYHFPQTSAVSFYSHSSTHDYAKN